MGDPATRRILVVGIPPSGPDGLSPQVVKRIQEAEILCGGKRHLALFPKIGKERCVIGNNISELVERLGTVVGQHIVILASGDPLLYGIGATLVRELGADSLEILPHVSAAQEAWAEGTKPVIAGEDAQIVVYAANAFDDDVQDLVTHIQMQIRKVQHTQPRERFWQLLEHDMILQEPHVERVARGSIGEPRELESCSDDRADGIPVRQMKSAVASTETVGSKISLNSQAPACMIGTQTLLKALKYLAFAHICRR